MKIIVVYKKNIDFLLKIINIFYCTFVQFPMIIYSIMLVEILKILIKSGLRIQWTRRYVVKPLSPNKIFVD